MWGSQVRTFGHDAFKMQPLKFGTKFTKRMPLATKNPTSSNGKGKHTATAATKENKVKNLRKVSKAQKVIKFMKLVRKANSELTEVRSFDEIAISDGLSPEERTAAVLRVTMASKAQKVMASLDYQMNNINVASSTVPHPNTKQRAGIKPESPKGNTLDDTGDFALEVSYTCPRWSEITSYLFQNRGPCQLALDTMSILPVSSFYRYIRDCGGISLTPLEFWNFLGTANDRYELFM